MARARPFKPQPLPIRDIAWVPLIPLMGRANRQIADYNAIVSTLPNPDVLLSPFTTQEAVLSSRMEGTQATLGDVLRFEAGEAPPKEERLFDIQEIINYRRALGVAQQELRKRPFGLNLLLRLHTILLDSVRGRNKGRGHFRKEQNWVGSAGTPIEKASFIPPSPADLVPHLHAWESYYHMERPDQLVQLAVVHAQFEILHPFLDGNGRLGRILIPLFLYEQKILSRPIFYLSEYLEENREVYIERLRDIGKTKDAWNAWVEFFLLALEEQARRNSLKARAVLHLYNNLKHRCIDLTHSQYAVPLLDQIFQRPVFQTSHMDGGRGMPTRAMTMTLLKKLKDANILQVVRRGSGRQGQILALGELINLSDGKRVF